MNDYIPPGTLVALDHDEDPTEYGVVVHCYHSKSNEGAWDCKVAFFGEALPTIDDEPRVYVLRYFAGSLRIVGPKVANNEHSAPKRLAPGVPRRPRA